MNVVRTLALMLMTAIVVAFVVFNWGPPASVNLWGGQLATWRKTSEGN